MHLHFNNLRHFPQNLIFDFVRDSVAFAHRNVSLQDDLKVAVETESHLADMTLVQTKDFSRTLCNASDTIFQRWLRRHICKLENCRLNLLPSVKQHHYSRCESRPCIRGGPSRSAQESNRNTSEGKRRYNGIAAVPPGVTFDRDAFDGMSDRADVPKQQFFDEECASNNQKGVWRRHAMRGPNSVNTLRNNDNRCAEQRESNHHSGERLSFAMTIGMTVVG